MVTTKGPSANFVTVSPGSLPNIQSIHPTIHPFSFPPTMVRWEVLPLGAIFVGLNTSKVSAKKPLVSVSTLSVTDREAQLTHSIYALRTQECLTCERGALSCVFVRWSVRPTHFNPADVRLRRWQPNVQRPHGAPRP
jgi:hypothetical protein